MQWILSVPFFQRYYIRRNHFYYESSCNRGGLLSPFLTSIWVSHSGWGDCFTHEREWKNLWLGLRLCNIIPYGKLRWGLPYLSRGCGRIIILTHSSHNFWAYQEDIYRSGGIYSPTITAPWYLSHWPCTAGMWSRCRCSSPISDGTPQCPGGIGSLWRMPAWSWGSSRAGSWIVCHWESAHGRLNRTITLPGYLSPDGLLLHIIHSSSSWWKESGKSEPYLPAWCEFRWTPVLECAPSPYWKRMEKINSIWNTQSAWTIFRPPGWCTSQKTTTSGDTF